MPARRKPEERVLDAILAKVERRAGPKEPAAWCI
jgi:hypothetical protein